MINVLKTVIFSVILSFAIAVPLSVTTDDENDDGNDASKNNEECITDSGPKSGQKCVFPFLFSGKMYHSCTEWNFDEDKSNKGKLWCSTRVDEFGSHQKGNYGFCSLSCKGVVRITSDSKNLVTSDDEVQSTGFVFDEELPGILDNPL